MCRRSPRQNYLYLRAELTRPCLVEASCTSNHATQRQDEASTREKLTSANLRGYDEPIRSAYVRTEVTGIGSVPFSVKVGRGIMYEESSARRPVDSPEGIKAWCCVSTNVFAAPHPCSPAGPSLD